MPPLIRAPRPAAARSNGGHRRFGPFGARPDPHDYLSEAPGADVYGFPRDVRPVLETIVVVAVIAAAVAIVYRLWHMHLNIPGAYSGDGLFSDVIAKSIRDNGWLLHNPRTGAPFSGTLYDYPAGGENIHFALLKLVSFFTSTYGAAQNITFLLTYLLVGVSAYYVARHLKLGRGPSLVVGVLYSFLPYHAAHGIQHLSRSGYYIVPLVVLVILWAIDYRTRFFKVEGHRSARSVRRWRWMLAFGVCVLLGASDTQNSIFACCLIAAVGVVLAVGNRDRRALFVAGALVGTVGLSLVANNAPYLYYRYKHGGNPDALQRSLQGVDTYALSISQLVLPTENHRIPALAHLRSTARTQSLMGGENGDALGAVAAVGLVVAFGALLWAGLRRRSSVRDRSPTSGGWKRIEPLIARFGVLSVVAIVFAVAGGVSYLMALAGLTTLRTWNRIVLFIAFFGLVTTALLLDLLFRRLRARGVAAGVIVAIVVAVLAVGVFDQTTSKDAPNYKAIAQRYKIDESFFRTLEQRLPRGAMVFEYPVVRFPESPPVGKLQDYEQFIGYLHTTHLRWSYGAMKGRDEADWQLALDQLPPDTALASLTAIGFHGVYINRDAYAVPGAVTVMAPFEQAVAAVLGQPMLTSSDGRLVYYDLQPLRDLEQARFTAGDRAALRDAALNPVTPQYGDGFSHAEQDSTNRWRWAADRAQLELDNPSDREQQVAIGATLMGQTGTVHVAGPGYAQTLPVQPGGTAWQTVLRLRPGRTIVRFDSSVPRTLVPTDPRHLVIQVVNLTVRAPALHDAMCRVETGPARPADCTSG